MEKEDNTPKPVESEPLDIPEPDSEPNEEEKEESVGRLKSKLDDAYGKQDDLKSKYMRAVADLENLRKRSIVTAKTLYKEQDLKLFLTFYQLWMPFNSVL